MGTCGSVLLSMEQALERSDGAGFYAAYRTIDQLEPGPGDEGLALVDAHRIAGAFRRGLTVLHAWLRHNPVTAGAAMLRAQLLFELGDAAFPRALTDALSLDPASATVLLRLANYHLVEEDFALAYRLFQRAVTLGTCLYDAHIGAAASAFGAGDRGRAIHESQLAIAYDDARSEAYTILAAAVRDRDLIHAFRAYVRANAHTIHLLPTPPVYGITEARRGLIETIRALIRGSANVEAFMAQPPASDSNERRTPFTIGNLRPFASLPADGQYHPMDHNHCTAARRLRDGYVRPLPLPANYAPVRHRLPLQKSPFVSWIRGGATRFDWARNHSYPDFAGSDGDFMTRITGAIVWDGFIFSQNGEFLDECFLFDELALSRNQRAFSEVGDKICMTLPKLAESVEIIEPCIYLGGYHMNSRLVHYGTWLLDVCPKLGLYESLAETKDLRIVLPKRAYNIPFVRETLEAFGIPDERLILLSGGTAVFRRLYLAQIQSGLYDPKGMAWVRQRLSGYFAAKQKEKRGGRRIYLSRGDAPTRRVINEQALMESLDKYGFEKIESTPLSMQERFEYFSEAECVIAVNGGGMASLLFCKPETTVIVIGTDGFYDIAYQTLVSELNLKYYLSIETREIDQSGDFLVSLERMQSILDQAGIQPLA